MDPQKIDKDEKSSLSPAFRASFLKSCQKRRQPIRNGPLRTSQGDFGFPKATPGPPDCSPKGPPRLHNASQNGSKTPPEALQSQDFYGLGHRSWLKFEKSKKIRVRHYVIRALYEKFRILGHCTFDFQGPRVGAVRFLVNIHRTPPKFEK